MYTTEEMAGAMAVEEVTRLNIRDEEGRRKVYELKLYQLQELEGVAIITPEGKVRFVK